MKEKIIKRATYSTNKESNEKTNFIAKDFCRKEWLELTEHYLHL